MQVSMGYTCERTPGLLSNVGEHFASDEQASDEQGLGDG